MFLSSFVVKVRLPSKTDVPDEKLLVFDDRDDDADIPLAHFLDCVADLGVVEPLAVVNDLDLFHVGL